MGEPNINKTRLACSWTRRVKKAKCLKKAKDYYCHSRRLSDTRSNHNGGFDSAEVILVRGLL